MIRILNFYCASYATDSTESQYFTVGFYQIEVLLPSDLYGRHADFSEDYSH